MSIVKVFFAAVCAGFFFSAGLSAGDNVLLALRAAPAQEPERKTAGLLAPATAQAPVPEPEVSGFDVLSELSDPLYREGSMEVLKEAAKQDELKARERLETEPALRDAPADTSPASVKPPAPRSMLRRPKVKKPVPADPLKVKNTL